MKRARTFSIGGILAINALLPIAAPAQETEFSSLSEALSTAQSYAFGDSGAAMEYIRARVMEVQLDPTRRDDVANALAELLDDPASSDAFKHFACKQLYIIGGEGQVDELLPLLVDERYAHLARYALEVIPSAAINDALWKAIGEVEGPVAAGLTASLAVRGGAEAVARLTELLSHESEAVVTAAIIGLGRQGGNEAEIALREAVPTLPEEFRTEIYESLLACADAYRRAGDEIASERLYSDLMMDGMPVPVRLGALEGLVDLGREKAVPLVVAAITSGEAPWPTAAMAYVRTLGGPEATATFTQLLADAAPDLQVELLRALADRGDPLALETIIGGLDSAEASVRHATIDALGDLGNETTVPLLVAGVLSEDGETARRSRESLIQLPDFGTNGAIVAAYEIATPEVRTILAGVLAERRASDALPTLLETAEFATGETREAAFLAIGKLARQDDVNEIASLLYGAEDESVRTAAARALALIFRRILPAEERAELLRSLYEDAPTDLSQAAALRIIGDLGADRLLPLIVNATESNDAVLRDGAIRALAGWPNATPLEQLHTLARTLEAETHRALAVEGYVRMLRLPSSRPERDTLAGFKNALALSDSPALKRNSLAGIAELQSVEALDLAEGMLADGTVHAEAAIAAEKIRRHFYTLTASVATESAGLAADGDINTKWETTGAQKPGQWIEIDMSRPAAVKGVVLDASRTEGGYPRSYNVYLYERGGQPGEPIATGEGSEGSTEINFARPVSGQLLRIEQTGTTEEAPWVIHEIRILPG